MVSDGRPGAQPLAQAHTVRCRAGPIPFLPENDILVRRLEKQWGELGSYQGIRCALGGELLACCAWCSGVGADVARDIADEGTSI